MKSLIIFDDEMEFEDLKDSKRHSKNRKNDSDEENLLTKEARRAKKRSNRLKLDKSGKEIRD